MYVYGGLSGKPLSEVAWSHVIFQVLKHVPLHGMTCITRTISTSLHPDPFLSARCSVHRFRQGEILVFFKW